MPEMATFCIVRLMATEITSHHHEANHYPCSVSADCHLADTAIIPQNNTDEWMHAFSSIIGKTCELFWSLKMLTGRFPNFHFQIVF